MTELKKLCSECEFDNFQHSLIKDMIVFCTRDKCLRERLLRECDLTLSKAISAGYATEKIRKHAREILRSQPTTDIDKIFKTRLNKSSHNTRSQNTRDFIKKSKFCDSSHPRGICPAYGRVCLVCNKNNHFKIFCPRVGKKVHEIEKVESDEPCNQSDYEFFIETVNSQDSTHINQIMNKNSDWSITIHLNGIIVSQKRDPGAQCDEL